MTEASAHFDEAEGALIVSGVWQADAASALPKLAGKSVRILDGAGVTRLDTNGAWLLLAAARPQASDPMPELRSFQSQHLAMLELVAQHSADTAAQPEPRSEGVLALIGRGALALWGHVVGLLDFVGRLVLELAALAG
ncbi:MAG TPA: ABC transporter permease, partial [Thiobacillus sp.]|nr:ABC transporter permease [Thiobacillus sp.]